MKLSVLICTYNRPDLMAQCLDALICRTTEKPDEIVVVNGGGERTDEMVLRAKGKEQRAEVRDQSSEGTRQKAEGRDQGSGARSQIQIKLIKTVNKNLAASRNVGLPHCTGDIIAMTDDDAEVFPDWVTQMKRAHAEHPEAGAAGGPILGSVTDTLVARVADVITFASWPGPQYVRTLPGVNVSYKREVVEHVGAQDEALFRGEDVDYNWRLQKLGYKVYFDPQIKVYHYHRPTLRLFLNQHYMYGRAYYLVRRKWPEMYCVYPHALRRPKDFLRAVNFFLAPFYEPVRHAARLERVVDRLLAYPILLANQLAWRCGMLRQALLSLASQSRGGAPLDCGPGSKASGCGTKSLSSAN